MKAAVSSLRIWLIVAATVGAAISIAGWQVWRSWHAPAPPPLPLDEAEPALARAVESARTRVDREPYSAVAWGELGKLLRAVDYLQPAVTCFAQAARLEPDNPRWPYLEGETLSRENAAAAVEPLQHALALCERRGEDVLVARLRLGETLLAAGAYRQAQVHFQRALEIEPDHPSAHLNLGIIALAQNDLTGARSHLLQCRESPFSRQKANTHLAIVCRRLGKTAEAEEFAKKAVRLPADVHWSDPYVMDCLRRGSALGAISAGFRLVEQLEKQGNYRAAVAQLRDMAEGHEDYRVYVALGKNLLHLGDAAEGARALENAIRLVPENVQAYYYLSKIRWLEGEHERSGNAEGAAVKYRAAAGYARKVLQRNPDHAPAHVALGRCLERLGQRREALGELERAVKCGPENPDAWLHLGELTASAGRLAEARRYLEEAARLAGPDDLRAETALKRLAGNAKS
jgi:tetratricopeptide (TPR) repeat protein